MQEIEVVIETLLLDGFEPADGRCFSTAFQDEFTRRLRENGLPSSWVIGKEQEIQIHVPTLEVETSADPQSMGRQMANALYEGSEA